MEDHAFSDVVGIILMVAIAVLLAGLIFYFTINLYSTHHKEVIFPVFSQDNSEGKLIVLHIERKVKWDDFQIIPDTVLRHDSNNDGYVDVGEYIYNCTGKKVSIIYTPANVLLGSWDFS